MTKKTRHTYSEDIKAEARRLLQEGKTQNQVSELTGIGKGSIVKIAADLKSDSAPKKNAKSVSASADAFKVELLAIQHRIQEVEELLNGSLRQELDALRAKEQAIQGLIELY